MTDFELDPTIEQIARDARRAVAIDPDVRERLIEMVRIEAGSEADVDADHDVVSIRRSRFSITRSPVGVSLLAAGLVGIGVLGGLAANSGRDSRVTGQSPTAVVNRSQLPASTDTVVTFVFPFPAAASVSVAGDFNQWSTSATPMTRLGASDYWTATVPMSVGRHIYSYHAVGKDGEQWVADPHAPAAPDDGFGRANSVILVSKGSTL